MSLTLPPVTRLRPTASTQEQIFPVGINPIPLQSVAFGSITTAYSVSANFIFDLNGKGVAYGFITNGLNEPVYISFDGTNDNMMVLTLQDKPFNLLANLRLLGRTSFWVRYVSATATSGVIAIQVAS
jgi:hypothetical protein